MPEPVRLALVGCGRIAQVAHLPALEKADGVELVAVCDPSAAVASAVARRYGVAGVHTDPGSLWADAAVEAVLIATPDRFHHRLGPPRPSGPAGVCWSRSPSPPPWPRPRSRSSWSTGPG